MKPVIFSFVVLLMVSCSSKLSDKELLDKGNSEIHQEKVPEAVASFEELLNEYPDSKLAPEALVQLATIYQNKLIKNISEEESIKKAVMNFRKIYDDYPESDAAPKGLFMAGFLLANELRDYEQATEVYNLFLEKFPDSELAVSAREELDNMGLTPEQILQKNLAKEE